MNNAIQHINIDEINILKNLYKDNKKIYLVELDGRKNKKEKDFLREISEKFHFPVLSTKFNCYIPWFEGAYTHFKSKLPTWEICEDWLTDLNWLDYDSFILIITNYKFFLSSNNKLKIYIISQLENIILPWWENDVKNCMVDGKVKKFNIYLVE